MDMNIDTNVFHLLRISLQNGAGVLENATSSVSSEVSRAGHYLEGEQYEYAVEEVKASCASIGVTVSNISAMITYVNSLEDYVNEYLGCKYNG